jgi:cobalt-zinc-cadmium efflux system membrane fusion protein
MNTTASIVVRRPSPFRCGAARGCLAALLLAAVGGCRHDAEPAQVEVEAAPYTLTESGLLRVRPDIAAALVFATVEKSPVFAEVHGVGEVDFTPGALTALRVPFDGIIESVEVAAGARVERDSVLARVRSSELARMRADARRLAAELTGQYDALRRINELVQGDVISNRRSVEVQAKVGGLEAERNGILVALRAARTSEEGEDLFELLSPRDGQVIERHIDPGEHAHDPENQPAFIIADPSFLIVTASFPERDAPLLKEGFQCRIAIPALGDAPLVGHVVAVVRAIDRQKRTVDVTCAFDALTSGVRAHMLAHVTVSVTGEPQLVVPREAVLLRRDNRVVLVRHGENDLERRPVVVGTCVDTRMAILSGVSEGDEIVSGGAVLLDGELDRLL